MSEAPRTAAPLRVLSTIATIIGAGVIGFGVPLLWIWIGSQVEGGDGASSTSFLAAMVILFGIIFSYVGLGWIAGWIQSRLEGDQAPGRRGPPPSARYPWMQSQGDTQGLPGAGSELRPLERVFVVTTLLVSGAFWLWFLFFAEGGGLPNP